MGMECDKRVRIIETLIGILSYAADAERCARNVAETVTKKSHWLRRRLRNNLKFRGLTPEQKKLLIRLQARILMDAWPAKSIVEVCDACEEAGVDEWRVKAAFEEVCDTTIDEAAKMHHFFAFTQGIPEEQGALLLSIWMMINLPVPPLPEHNEPYVECCRKLNLDEWRIAAATTRVTKDDS